MVTLIRIVNRAKNECKDQILQVLNVDHFWEQFSH